MKDLIDYIIKNKYVIICIAVVVALYAFGIVEFMLRFLIFAGLIVAAIWIGKKLQDNEGRIKEIFNFRKFREYKGFKDNVYYYQNTDKKDKE